MTILLTICAIGSIDKQVKFSRHYHLCYLNFPLYKPIKWWINAPVNEYLACCTKNRCFALTIPWCFAKTFEEEKKQYSYMRITMHVNTMFTVLVKSTYGVDRRHSWCRYGLLTVDPGIARRESSWFRSIVTGSDSEQWCFRVRQE